MCLNIDSKGIPAKLRPRRRRKILKSSEGRALTRGAPQQSWLQPKDLRQQAGFSPRIRQHSPRSRYLRFEDTEGTPGPANPSFHQTRGSAFSSLYYYLLIFIFIE